MPLQVKGKPPKLTDLFSMVRRRERDADLDDKQTSLLMPSQEYKTDKYSNGAERGEGTVRAEPAHDGYDKPVQYLGEENTPDPVSDRDYDIQR